MGFEEKDGNYAGFDIELRAVRVEETSASRPLQPIIDMKEAELQTARLTPSEGIRHRRTPRESRLLRFLYAKHAN